MMNSSKNLECRLRLGARIVGKWHHKPYRIVKKLGEGATGIVYLADSQDGPVALKVGMNNMSITSEVNVLKHFSKVQGHILGPSLLDVDDIVMETGTYPFYVMEYLKGTELISFMQKRGDEWIGILMIQLLGDLDRLHRAGWVFGDLKPDNLIVVGPPARIRWLDVGGTTLLGRSIKEFTEFYDRGYWGMGTRKAEPSYDLFAVAMIMINFAYPSRFDKKADKPMLQQLKEVVEAKPMLAGYRHVIMKALQGKYSDAQIMRKELVEAVNNRTTYVPKKEIKKRTVKTVKKKKKKASYMIELSLIASFFMLAYILYLYGQIM